MDFGTWVALILGGIALLMAMPTLAQMYWGRPKPEIDFEETNCEGAKFLQCTIRNRHVRNWLLRLLHVRRETAVDVWAMLEIRRYGTQEVMLPKTPMKFTGRDGEVQSVHVSISSGTIGRRFGVVFSNPNDQKVEVLAEPTTILAPGKYLADIDVIAAERRSNRVREFTVHANGSVYWLSD